MTARTLSDLLADAAERVGRVGPETALAEARTGAVVVDIRSSDARRRDGVVPGSVHIPRTVLEWRLEPGGRWRTPHVAEGCRVLVLCDQGYSSLLAAASLAALGVDAVDVQGGFTAWRDAGLPVAVADDPPLGSGELQGMRPADG
jgi:rhodanese-related sulfurtransferase